MSPCSLQPVSMGRSQPLHGRLTGLRSHRLKIELGLGDQGNSEAGEMQEETTSSRIYSEGEKNAICAFHEV